MTQSKRMNVNTVIVSSLVQSDFLKLQQRRYKHCPVFTNQVLVLVLVLQLRPAVTVQRGDTADRKLSASLSFLQDINISFLHFPFFLLPAACFLFAAD